MIALRLVIDTNIVVSAALKPHGLQRTVLLLAVTKPARLYVSEAIMDEYREVLARPKLKIRKGLRQQVLQFIKRHSRCVRPARTLQVTSDPDDNKFLECADAARADYLVTGNQRHFPKFWKKIRALDVAQAVVLGVQTEIGGEVRGLRRPNLVPQLLQRLPKPAAQVHQVETGGAEEDALGRGVDTIHDDSGYRPGSPAPILESWASAAC